MKNKYKHNPQQSCDENWYCTKCHSIIDVDCNWENCSIPDEVDQKSLDKGKGIKQLSDFNPQYNCRFHPTDWFHEVGCPHMKWTKKQLQEELNNAKQSNAYLGYLLSINHPTHHYDK